SGTGSPPGRTSTGRSLPWVAGARRPLRVLRAPTDRYGLARVACPPPAMVSRVLAVGEDGAMDSTRRARHALVSAAGPSPDGSERRPRQAVEPAHCHTRQRDWAEALGDPCCPGGPAHCRGRRAHASVTTVLP